MSTTHQDEPSSPFGLSLVAFYGPKPKQLVDYLLWCLELLDTAVSAGFKPYELDQIHATMVGLEGRYIDGQPVNENFLRLGSTRPMNLPGAIEFLREASEIPFQCRLGGFRSGEEYGFQSFGRHPFERSFEIQKSGAVVVIGWPFAHGTVSRELVALRRGLESYNILHKYHMTESVEDNDCYFVLGHLDVESADPAELAAVTGAIRAKIAEAEPTLLTVDRDCLAFVRYADRSLPTSSSLRMPLRRDGSLLDPSTPLVESTAKAR